jgi:hypothetical protein
VRLVGRLALPRCDDGADGDADDVVDVVDVVDECAQQPHVPGLCHEPGFLGEFAHDGVVEGLSGFDGAAGQLPGE